MSFRRKSARQLVAVGRQNVRHARHHLGAAWREIVGMQTVLARLNRQRPLKSLSAS